MRLYLSSYMIPVPSALEDLLGKNLADTKCALITNSKDYYSDFARSVKVQSNLDRLASYSLKADQVDLRGLNGPEEVKSKLSQYDLVWVVGGNTFCLRYAMKISGFDQVIQSLLEEGLVWGGDSAGAIVAGPSLRGFDAVDNPEFAQEIIYDGLNLVDVAISPHVDSLDYVRVMPAIREANKDNSHYYELQDNEALVFNGGHKEKVSREYTPEEALGKVHEL